MARLSAGLGGMPAGWPSAFGHPQGPAGGFATTPFPPTTFPGLFGASSLGFHPLDFTAMRLPHGMPNSDLDLKGLDPRAVLSAYIGDLSARNNGLASSPTDGALPPVSSQSSDADIAASHAQLTLSQQAEKFKAAAAAMYGHRFFPHAMMMRPTEKTLSQNSPSANEKNSNGASSPHSHSSHGSNSISPSLLNSNNNSNISGKGGERASSSGSADRSPVPELKNIERMVEGLHSNEHIFVPTSSSVAT